MLPYFFICVQMILFIAPMANGLHTDTYLGIRTLWIPDVTLFVLKSGGGDGVEDGTLGGYIRCLGRAGGARG